MLPVGLGAIILVLAWKSVRAFRGDEGVISQVMDEPAGDTK